MAEKVVHMNVEDDETPIKFPDIVVDWGTPPKISCEITVASPEPINDSYAAAKVIDSVISIRELTPEEHNERLVTIRATHSGRRKAIQDKWDEALKETHGKIVYAEQISVV